MAAPFSMRSSTTSFCPARVARISGVSPLLALRVDHRPFVDQRARLLEITVARGVMERSGKREWTAGKEHKQGHGDLNHFRPPRINLRLRYATRRLFTRTFPASMVVMQAHLLDRLTTFASISTTVLVGPRKRRIRDETLPGEPIRDVPGQTRQARAVGADQRVLFDLPVLTVGDERGGL